MWKSCWGGDVGNPCKPCTLPPRSTHPLTHLTPLTYSPTYPALLPPQTCNSSLPILSLASPHSLTITHSLTYSPIHSLTRPPSQPLSLPYSPLNLISSPSFSTRLSFISSPFRRCHSRNLSLSLLVFPSISLLFHSISASFFLHLIIFLLPYVHKYRRVWELTSTCNC